VPVYIEAAAVNTHRAIGTTLAHEARSRAWAGRPARRDARVAARATPLGWQALLCLRYSVFDVLERVYKLKPLYLWLSVPELAARAALHAVFQHARLYAVSTERAAATGGW